MEVRIVIHALAGDMGGTNMRSALVDETGRIVRRSSVRTPSDRSPREVVDSFLDVLSEVAQGADVGEIAGIGLAIAGPTDPETGLMFNPPNLQQFDGFSAKPQIEERFGMKTIVANDATLAALGEQRFGAGRGRKDLVYLTVSTGIGGGFVQGGRLLQGARGFAGEIGQMVIDPDGPECLDGNNGCFEGLCSGTAVARIARERLAQGAESVLTQYCGGDLDAVDSQMVVRGASEDDELSKQIMDEVSTNLGIGIVNLLHILDPELVVMGGGMSNALDLMLPAMNREIDRRYMIKEGKRAEIVRSALGDDVGLLGAAAAAFDLGGEAGPG